MKNNKKTTKHTKSNFYQRNIQLVLLAILTVTVLIIYAPTSTYDFVNIDDNSLIYENPTIINPDIPYKACFDRLKGGVHYKPLVFLSWKLEYNLLGNSPSHFHTINWVFHLLNTLLLFFVLKILFTRLYESDRKSLILAFFVTLLFTINPLRIESVAWATERKDVMFGFFFLLGWLLYLQYLEKRSYFYLILGAVAYLMSGLSKSMGLPLFAVLFLTDVWYSRKPKAALIFDKIPYLIVLVILLNLYGIIDFSKEVTPVGPAIESQLVEDNMEILTTVDFLEVLPSNVQWVLTTSARFVLWIVHSLVPIKLSVHYSHNGVYAFLGKSIYLFPFISIGLFLLAWKYRKKNNTLLAGLLFFAVTLSPALLLKASGQGIFLSDRYTYIPSIGLFFILVVMLDQWKSRQKASIALALVIGFYSIQSLVNVGHWKNSEALFTQTLKVYPNSGLGHLNLGKYYLGNGDTDEALKIYTKGINRAPGYYKLYSNRGKLFFDQGKIDLAIADFNKCLSLKPDYEVALTNRGAAYGSKQEYEKALEDFNKALEIKPWSENALSNRGLLYLFTKDYEKAIIDYSKYLERVPNDADVISMLALSYQNTGQPEVAIENYNKAIKINPSKGTFYYNRSLAYNTTGNKDMALKDALQAQKLGANVNQSYINRLQEQELNNQ